MHRFHLDLDRVYRRNIPEKRADVHILSAPSADRLPDTEARQLPQAALRNQTIPEAAGVQPQVPAHPDADDRSMY